MNGNAAGNKSAISNVNVSAEHDVVGYDIIVPDNAIVSDMRVRHKKVAVANFRKAVFFDGTMNGAEFSERIVGTDAYFSRRAWRTDVLSKTADYCVFMNFTVRSHIHAAFNANVSGDIAAGFDYRIGFDNTKRSNINVFRDFCGGIYNC